jgi:hypothetical protein
MGPSMGERAARQAKLEFSQRYSRGELEEMGSSELLEATSRGTSFITGIVDNYAALDGNHKQKLIDYSIQLVHEQRETS